MNFFVKELAAPRTVLELGSGPGWDADYLESLGAQVRRTDAAQAFCDLQAARGKQVERLNAITDAYTSVDWPAYSGIMAMYVLQHIERADIDALLRKAFEALSPDGYLLVSIRDGGDEELWEQSESGNRYHITLWDAPSFEMRLRRAGFEPTRTTRHADDEGPWLVMLVRGTANRKT